MSFSTAIPVNRDTDTASDFGGIKRSGNRRIWVGAPRQSVNISSETTERVAMMARAKLNKALQSKLAYNRMGETANYDMVGTRLSVKA